MVIPFSGKVPRLGEGAFIAPSAQVIGDVTLGEDASVWFGSVVRGDMNYIRIGARTNIQDLTVIHVNAPDQPTVVEEEVTVGHRVILHGCHVGRRALIGMGAVILDDVRIGEESLVAAGCVVSPGTVVPPRTLIRGVPGRIVRELKEEELARLEEGVRHYVEIKDVYMKENRLV